MLHITVNSIFGYQKAFAEKRGQKAEADADLRSWLSLLADFRMRRKVSVVNLCQLHPSKPFTFNTRIQIPMTIPCL